MPVVEVGHGADSYGTAGGSRGGYAQPAALARFGALGDPGANTLAGYARRYLDTEVRGIQSPNTLEAKTRDIVGFITWFVG